MLSTPTLNEKRAICTWILPRGKRPNRSHAETKVNLIKKINLKKKKNSYFLVNAVDRSFFIY